MESFPRQSRLAPRWRARGPRGLAVLLQERLFAPPSSFLYGSMHSGPRPVCVSVRRTSLRGTNAWEDGRSRLLPGVPGSVFRSFSRPDKGVAGECMMGAEG